MDHRNLDQYFENGRPRKGAGVNANGDPRVAAVREKLAAARQELERARASLRGAESHAREHTEDNALRLEALASIGEASTTEAKKARQQADTSGQRLQAAAAEVRRCEIICEALGNRVRQAEAQAQAELEGEYRAAQAALVQELAEALRAAHEVNRRLYQLNWLAGANNYHDLPAAHFPELLLVEDNPAVFSVTRYGIWLEDMRNRGHAV